MNPKPRTVLVIEDEVDVAELISYNFGRRGYRVITAHDGISGLKAAFSENPDLVILDIMLPGKDGYSVFKELRRDKRTTHVPVLMLTAQSQTEQKIAGFEAGADDYLTKPFSPKELVLRATAVLRRTESQPSALLVQLGPLRFDKNSMSFYLEDEVVDLTTTEFKLLLYLAERPNEVQSRSELLSYIWGYSDEVNSRTLDTHTKRLRQKLGEHAALLKTVRSVGYMVEI